MEKEIEMKVKLGCKNERQPGVRLMLGRGDDKVLSESQELATDPVLSFSRKEKIR